MSGSLTMARSAWAIWALFVIVIAIAVVRDPAGRTVTPNYHQACHNWLDGRPLYEGGPHGFLYFPQAALLFAPFAQLGSLWGDVAWRAAGISALAAATWRLALLLGQRRKPAVFLLATLTAIPPALASARNGQMNLLLASLTAMAFVSLAGRQRGAAAAWLCLGLALKPLMAFPMIVAAVADRRIIPALALGLLIVATAPFLMHDPHYVWQEYGACLSKLFRAGAPGAANPHADLFGMLAAAGCGVPVHVQAAIRATLAFVAIGLGVAIRCRMSAARAGLYTLALTSGCLALINPRMENNGYVLLSPALGGLAALAWTRRPRRPASRVWLAIATVGIAGSYELTRGANFWVCPLLTCLVMVHVVAGFENTGQRLARFVLWAKRLCSERHLGRSLQARLPISHHKTDQSPERHGDRSLQKPCEAPPMSSNDGSVPPPHMPARGDHDLTVVIPAYNEGSRLPRTLMALKSWLEASGLDYHVLVVDDGSSDATASVSDDFGPKFRTLRLPTQRGKGAAVRAGMRAATGRIVAFTDADLPYELEALRIGYQWIESGCCEVVFGARDVAGAATHVPRRLTRALASFMFRGITKRLVSPEITDTQCGLKIFNGRAARAIFGRAVVDGFAFDAEIVWLCHRLELAWRRVPVTLVNEYSSTLSLRRHSWRMLLDLPRLRIAHRGWTSPTM